MRGKGTSPSHVPARPGWPGAATTRRGAVVIGALLIMILGPLAALDAPRPAMLGWQMYSSVTYLPLILVEKADGVREERRIGDIASGFRPEVNYFEPVAQFLCAKEPGIVRVHLKRECPEREMAVECSHS